MPPFKRRTFLINKRFQFRLAFYVCSLLILTGFLYPLIVKNLFEFFIRYAASDPNGPAVTTILKTRDDMLSTLFATQVVFLVLTFLASIFLGHRIAGPLHKLRLFFAKVKEGDLTQTIAFRKHDHFQELATDYNTMMASLQQRVATATTHIERAAAHCDENTQKELHAALAALPKVFPNKSA